MTLNEQLEKTAKELAAKRWHTPTKNQINMLLVAVCAGADAALAYAKEKITQT